MNFIEAKILMAGCSASLMVHLLLPNIIINIIHMILYCIYLNNKYNKIINIIIKLWVFIIKTIRTHATSGGFP